MLAFLFACLSFSTLLPLVTEFPAFYPFTEAVHTYPRSSTTTVSHQERPNSGLDWGSSASELAAVFGGEFEHGSVSGDHVVDVLVAGDAPLTVHLLLSDAPLARLQENKIKYFRFFSKFSFTTQLVLKFSPVVLIGILYLNSDGTFHWWMMSGLKVLQPFDNPPTTPIISSCRESVSDFCIEVKAKTALPPNTEYSQSFYFVKRSLRI